jgi:TrmH family RNA methyltransferase
VQHVTSRHNPRLKEAAALIASSRERRKSGKCVLEGEHVVATYVERYGAPESLIVTADALALPAVRSLAERQSARTLVVSESLFAATASLPASVGLLAVVPTPKPAMLGYADFNLLVEDVQDPGNIGSILRSAAAAGVAQVLLSKHCAFAWSPKVLRAGQGAHFAVTIHEDVDLFAWASSFRASGGEVVAMVSKAAHRSLRHSW